MNDVVKHHEEKTQELFCEHVGWNVAENTEQKRAATDDKCAPKVPGTAKDFPIVVDDIPVAQSSGGNKEKT